jgi:hypothetical protein
MILSSRIRGVAMRKALVVLILLLVSSATYASVGPELYQFEVIGILNGNTIQVRWRQAPPAGSFSSEKAWVELVGIWSDPAREPLSAYARRLQFLTSLQGRLVRVPITFQGAPGGAIARPESPAEVLLEDGTSVNEFLLKNGLTILNEATTSGLSPAELMRYQAAETEASTRHLGIWAGEPQPYTEAKTLMRREREWKARQREGLGLFLVVQVILTMSILWLLYLHWNNPIAQKATLSLLCLPLGFLAVAAFSAGSDAWFARKFPVLAVYGIEAALIFTALAILNFVRLVVRGPAELWGAVGIGVRRAQSVFLFFGGLWVLIALFALVYRVGGAASWSTALSYSSSITLGVPATLLSQGAQFGFRFDEISLVERIAFIIWLGFCAAKIRPKSTFQSRTRRWNVGVAMASMLIVNISVVTGFALCFFAALGHAGLIEALNRSNCFWFSLATLFRQGSAAIPPGAPWIKLLQIIEVHLGLFLALVGFRVIYALTTSQGRDSGIQ